MDKALTHIQDNLESIKRVTQDEKPMEFWSARDLMLVLGYVKWQKFVEVIERAKIAYKSASQDSSNHFLPAPVKSSGGRPCEDYFLTRFACYLIAQNGDPRKPQIALAQTYFATQTRKQELPEDLKPEEDLKLIEGSNCTWSSEDQADPKLWIWSKYWCELMVRDEWGRGKISAPAIVLFAFISTAT